jgi:hypothetical protein
MTTWYGGHGWGWCGVLVNVPATVLLWGAIVAATVLAVRIAFRQSSDPPAPTGTGYDRRDGVVAARITRSETGDDEIYRRFM